jgi:hypothetical protein
MAMAKPGKVRQENSRTRKEEHKRALEGRSRDLEIIRQKLAKLLEEVPMGFGRAKVMHEVLMVQEQSGYSWRQILGMDPP